MRCAGRRTRMILACITRGSAWNRGPSTAGDIARKLREPVQQITKKHQGVRAFLIDALQSTADCIGVDLAYVADPRGADETLPHPTHFEEAIGGHS